MINWKNIKKRYPKAFQRLIDFHFATDDSSEVYGYIDSPDVWGEFIQEPHYVMRHLYDFFDEHKVFIQVRTSKMETAPDGFYWCYNIKVIDKETNEITDGLLNGRANSDYYYSAERKRCEEDAWIEAFEVLDNSIDEKEHRKMKLTKIKKK